MMTSEETCRSGNSGSNTKKFIKTVKNANANNNNNNNTNNDTDSVKGNENENDTEEGISQSELNTEFKPIELVSVEAADMVKELGMHYKVPTILIKSLFNLNGRSNQTNSNDQNFITNLESEIIEFIIKPNVDSWKMTPLNSYYRLLTHKLAEYYNLGHILSNDGFSMVLFKINTSLVNADDEIKKNAKFDQEGNIKPLDFRNLKFDPVEKLNRIRLSELYDYYKPILEENIVNEEMETLSINNNDVITNNKNVVLLKRDDEQHQPITPTTTTNTDDSINISSETSNGSIVEDKLSREEKYNRIKERIEQEHNEEDEESEEDSEDDEETEVIVNSRPKYKPRYTNHNFQQQFIPQDYNPYFAQPHYIPISYPYQPQVPPQQIQHGYPQSQHTPDSPPSQQKFQYFYYPMGGPPPLAPSQQQQQQQQPVASGSANPATKSPTDESPILHVPTLQGGAAPAYHAGPPPLYYNPYMNMGRISGQPQQQQQQQQQQQYGYSNSGKWYTGKHGGQANDGYYKGKQRGNRGAQTSQ